MVRRDCGLLMCVSFVFSEERVDGAGEEDSLVTDNSSSLRLRRIPPPTYTSFPSWTLP